MKPAIDSYCYHRYFGEWYPKIQSDPGRRMTVWDFIDRARDMGVQGVSLESCFLPWADHPFIDRLSETLQASQLEPVWAWGHPNGLGSGSRPQEVADLVEHLDVARRIGAKVMRICGGSRHTRPASWAAHRRGLLELLYPIIEHAEKQGVVVAMENHVDLLAEEMVELVETINSPWFGVCFDTANNLRLFEDPVTVARLLAPHARATHIKDVTTQRGNPKDFSFWPSVALGDGLVDLPAVLQTLLDVGYDGLLAIEVDYLHPEHGDEDQAVAKSVDYLRALLGANGIGAPAPGHTTTAS